MIEEQIKNLTQAVNDNTVALLAIAKVLANMAPASIATVVANETPEKLGKKSGVKKDPYPEMGVAKTGDDSATDETPATPTEEIPSAVLDTMQDKAPTLEIVKADPPVDAKQKSGFTHSDLRDEVKRCLSAGKKAEVMEALTTLGVAGGVSKCPPEQIDELYATLSKIS